MSKINPLSWFDCSQDESIVHHFGAELTVLKIYK